MVNVGDSLSLKGSSAKQFHGSAAHWNPEQLFLASLGQCHMLTFLFLASQRGLSVLRYDSDIAGTILMDADGVGGSFSDVTISPKIILQNTAATPNETIRDAQEVLQRVDDHCFIARSVRVPLTIRPQFFVE